ncbi:MAG: helix-turn-helix transcriptional regulator [Saprospiraceae bacterium]|nr:helix-turn-helix transcriptional regulator [Saprospiraceae bacterium]
MPAILGRHERLTDMVHPGDISKREKEILKLLAEGLSNHEMATHTGLSINTIKTHLKRIYKKIGARNRADAARIFMSK